MIAREVEPRLTRRSGWHGNSARRRSARSAVLPIPRPGPGAASPTEYGGVDERRQTGRPRRVLRSQGRRWSGLAAGGHTGGRAHGAADRPRRPAGDLADAAAVNARFILRSARTTLAKLQPMRTKWRRSVSASRRLASISAVADALLKCQFFNATLTSSSGWRKCRC